jgi:hypothetical protein
MDGAEVFFAGMMLFCGVMIGFISTDSGWADDCAKAGFHRQGSSVYKCEKVK